MLQFLIQHQLWSTIALYWAFSGGVSAMPEPTANSNPGYVWLYRFLHTIAGNLTTAFAGRIPGLKTLLFILMVPLFVSTPACAAAHYTVHPGALNTVDSAAYDTLLVAESTIDQARLDYKSGQLPPGAKPALDALVESYNVARAAWLTYRGAVSTNAPSDEYVTQLNRNLTDLETAIRDLGRAK